METMKKTFKSYVAAWAILLVLFNMIAFLSGGITNTAKYTASFWIGYAFITLAFMGQLLCAKKAFEAENLQRLFYNISLISLSRTGLILTFVFGGLCMLISPLPYWVGAIICMIILAVTAIAVIKAEVAVDAVSEIDKKIKVKTFFIKSLTVDAEGLLARAGTDEIKAECKKVYEAVRYSDPMSDEALAATESQITLKFAELTTAVTDNNLEAVKKTANEVIILVDDRNKKCKLMK